MFERASSPDPKKGKRGPAMKPSVSKSYYEREFAGRPHAECIKEGTKNSRDWKATIVRLFYDTAQRMLMIVDNGIGMDAANRTSFVCIGESNADPKTQSGRFDTGSKFILIGHSSAVRVITAPKDDPDNVYYFDCTTDEYIDALRTGRELYPMVYPKDATTWPLLNEFKFGTILRYSLRDPKRTGLPELPELAEALTFQYPEKLRKVVTLNNEQLPTRELIGRPYIVDLPNVPGLGNFFLEVGRPKKARRGEGGILCGGYETGEVSISRLYSLLPPDIRELFPVELISGALYGTMSCSLFQDFINPDRISFNVALRHEKPRLLKLVLLLKEHLDAILERLELKRFTADETVTIEAEVSSLRERCNSVYDPEGKLRSLTEVEGPEDEPGGEDDGPDNPPGPTGPVDPTKKPAFRILGMGEREFLLNEEFTARLEVRDDLVDQVDPSSIHWDLDEVCGKVVRTSADPPSVTIRCTQFGSGRLTVEQINSPWGASAGYEVVRQHEFKLTPMDVSLAVGETVTIRAKHPKGKVSWTGDALLGTTEVHPNTKSVVYTATAIGHLELRAKDESGQLKSCTITVHGEMTSDEIVVRGRRFRPYFQSLEVGESSGQPITILADSGDDSPCHTMVINGAAPGCDAAKREGVWAHYLAAQLGFAYADYCFRHGLDPVSRAGSNPWVALDQRDVSAILRMTQAIGCEIYAEIYAAKD